MSDEYEPHPLRVQRKRTKGYKMPNGVVYVGRPTKWGNPFKQGTKAENTEQFRLLVCSDASMVHSIREALRGKRVACWCPLSSPCHADVLADIANSGTSHQIEAERADRTASPLANDEEAG